MSHKSKSGFTLLEILLVVGIIAILAAIVIIAINPGKSLAKTRDLQRKVGIAEINKALSQYYIDKGQYPPSLTTEIKGICVTGAATSGVSCTGKVDLSPLVPTYLAAIPTDPTGVGFQIGLDSSSHVMIIASLTETVSPLITIGTTTFTVIADQSPLINNGSGTLADPYQISNWSQLNHVRDDLTSNYILTASLSASTYGYTGLGNNWTPLGNGGATFTGNFNGNGNTISDLTIVPGGSNGVGFFGNSNGNISNLGLLNISINSVSSLFDIGGLVGRQNGGTISHCYSTGNISSNQIIVGGLVGHQFSGTISASFSSASLTSTTYYTGGLVGEQEAGQFSHIINSYATGNSTCYSRCGGLVGYQLTVGTANYETVTNSYSATHIVSTAGGVVGGLVGYRYSSDSHYPTFSSSFWDINTSGVAAPPCGNVPCSNVTGETTALMKTASTFSAWDTGIWNLVDGSYPTLK